MEVDTPLLLNKATAVKCTSKTQFPFFSPPTSAAALLFSFNHSIPLLSFAVFPLSPLLYDQVCPYSVFEVVHAKQKNHKAGSCHFCRHLAFWGKGHAL